MNAEPLIEPNRQQMASNRVSLPCGLLGFESIKHYALLADPSEQPFAWLKAETDTALAFVVVNLMGVIPNYNPEIPDADAAFLGITSTEDVLLLGIVTVHGPKHATVNLKGPIVVNRRSHLAKQVIIANSADYSVHHALTLSA